MKKTDTAVRFTLRRVLCFALCAVLLCMGLAACGSDKKELKIGIIQYMSHPSLDNCYNGVIEALKALDVPYTVDRQIGSSTSAGSDCSTFAQNMVAGSCDMIIAIATPVSYKHLRSHEPQRSLV